MKNYDLNKNRALFIAEKFIPKESYPLYEAEICNGCKYNNNGEENLECCYCQSGSYYEDKYTIIGIDLASDSDMDFEENKET